MKVIVGLSALFPHGINIEKQRDETKASTLAKIFAYCY